MCERCDARRASRGRENNAVRYDRVDEWFAGLTHTNKACALGLMGDVTLSAMFGLNVGNGITQQSTPLDIAEAVMDSYLSALEIEPNLPSRRDDVIEEDGEDYRLSDFLPEPE